MAPPTWVLMWLVRFMWTILPQSGYIHPDEFFQSVEVLAGDYFNFTVERPWEYNSSSPIRSIVIPHLISGPAFSILGYLGFHTCSNALLMLPRIFMTLLSFATDIIVYKTALALHYDADACTTTYVTSYITLVYHTRTLSNSVESFLFAALLCLVVKCCIKWKVVPAEINPRSKLTKAQRTKETPDIDKEWRYASGIAAVVVAGFFNRPTFLLFAFVPCVYWITNGHIAFWKDITIMMCVFRRVICLIVFAVPMQWVFILLDSMYFRDLTVEMIKEKGIIASIQNFLVVTPFNFIWYNTDVTNLAEHTLHPHYLHFAVNSQMLFGFLGICAFVSFVKTRGHLRYLAPNHEYTWKIFLLYSYMIPVLLLSIFPHQEPRFLIPVLCPLVLLFGQYIFGPVASEFWQFIWIMFNILGAIFFGILHQGGMINAINTVKFQHMNHIADQSVPNQQHVIFYNTYMPPRHLFTLPNNEDPPSLLIHDLKGQNPIEIVNLATKILKYTPESLVFFLAPRTVEEKFCGNTELKAMKRLDFKLLYQFSPHVTLEDPPDWTLMRQAMTDRLQCSMCEGTKCDRSMSRGLAGLFSLNLYQVGIVS